jgi:hypothetical protein
MTVHVEDIIIYMSHTFVECIYSYCRSLKTSLWNPRVMHIVSPEIGLPISVGVAVDI